MRFFLVHGTNGHPEENWFPWLKDELESRGFEVVVPDFPSGEEQSLENWADEFEKYAGQIDENTVFVGHSLGPAFILNVLENLDGEVKACFLVSTFAEQLGLEDFDPLNATFVEREFDWGSIRESCDSFYMFHSTDDPYVPLDKAEYVREKLGADLEIIEGGCHLNEDAGYTEFPELLEKIEAEVL